jgi:exonuclease VII small subunit
MPNIIIPAQTARPNPLEMYPLSVERLTSYIEQALTQTPQLRQVWVSGEVSSMTSHPSGIYFTLKDPVGKAIVPAVIWKNQISELETKPQVGTQILALGKITVYAPHGKYQFQVQQVLPVGEGLQALRLQKLKERLSAEGLFDRERKQPLPIHPQTIAMARNSVLTYEEKVAQVEEILGEIESGDLELTAVFSQFAVAVESLQQRESFLSQQR